MVILKRAFLSCLRIAILGSLKLALFVYPIFLSATTSFAGVVTEGNGHVGGATESSGNGTAEIG